MDVFIDKTMEVVYEFLRDHHVNNQSITEFVAQLPDPQINGKQYSFDHLKDETHVNKLQQIHESLNQKQNKGNVEDSKLLEILGVVEAFMRIYGREKANDDQQNLRAAMLEENGQNFSLEQIIQARKASIIAVKEKNSFNTQKTDM